MDTSRSEGFLERTPSRRRATSSPTWAWSYYLSVSNSTSSTIGILGAGGETPTVTGLPASIERPGRRRIVFLFHGLGSDSGAETELWVVGRHAEQHHAARGFQLDLGLIGPVEPRRRRRDPLLHGGRDRRAGPALDVQRDEPGHDPGAGPGMASAVRRLVLRRRIRSSDVLVPIGGTLFFTADDTTHGAELWSDNVATGTTQLVEDIDPGPDSSDPQDLVDWRPALFRRQRWHQPPDQPALDVGRHGRDHLPGRLVSRGSTGQLRLEHRCVGPRSPWVPSSCSRSTTASRHRPVGDGWDRRGDPIPGGRRSRRFAVLNGTAYFLGSGAGIAVRALEDRRHLRRHDRGEGPLPVRGDRRLLRSRPGAGGQRLTSSTSPRATAAAAWISGPATARPPARASSRISTAPTARPAGILRLGERDDPFGGKLAFIADTGSEGRRSGSPTGRPAARRC